jgi:hypothetical protein
MSPRRRDEYTWWEYAIMAVVGVLIIVGGIVLVRVIGSSVEDSAAPAPTTPAIPSSLLPVTCSPDQWLDEATRTCLPRAECSAGEVYDEATNTCAIAAPRVTSIDPTSGPAAGGTAVTVVGFDFQRDATLTVGGIPATDVEVVDSSTITATAPASDLAYPVDVVVTNPDGQSGTLDNAYVFEQPQEQAITAVIPDTGSTQGGEAVIIKGRDFADDAVVAFNGRPAQEVVVLAPDTIRVVIPASAPGPASVNVRNPGEDLQTLRGGFTYVDQAPRVVDAIRPARGPAVGGTKVTITGSGFAPGAAVSIGGRPARQVDVVSSTRITAVTPKGGIGPADVAVRNPGIPAAILADGFRYVQAPVIDGVRPRGGPLEGGTEVTIRGSGFADDAVVTFGDPVHDPAGGGADRGHRDRDEPGRAHGHLEAGLHLPGRCRADDRAHPRADCLAVAVPVAHHDPADDAASLPDLHPTRCLRRAWHRTRAHRRRPVPQQRRDRLAATGGRGHRRRRGERAVAGASAAHHLGGTVRRRVSDDHLRLLLPRVPRLRYGNHRRQRPVSGPR